MGNTKPITQDKQFPMRVDDEFFHKLDESAPDRGGRPAQVPHGQAACR